jgi:hypothetical protein
MSDLSEAIETGARKFWGAFEAEALPEGGASKILSDVANPDGRDAYINVVGKLAEGPLSDDLASLMSIDPHVENIETIQAAGGSRGVGKYVIRAFQRRLCGNVELSKKIRTALEEANAQGVNIAKPTADGLSNATAVVIGTIIISSFAGPIGVAIAALASGVAWLIMRVGFDTFCDWARDRTE